MTNDNGNGSEPIPREAANASRFSLADLVERVPPEWQPVVRKYGPALLRMSADELWDWVEMLIQGNEYEAYRRLLQRLDNQQLAEAMQAALSSWRDANEENYRRLQLQRSALGAVLRVMLSTAIVAVGL